MSELNFAQNGSQIFLTPDIEWGPQCVWVTYAAESVRYPNEILR